jgi:hypothetical protein
MASSKVFSREIVVFYVWRSIFPTALCNVSGGETKRHVIGYEDSHKRSYNHEKNNASYKKDPNDRLLNQRRIG